MIGWNNHFAVAGFCMIMLLEALVASAQPTSLPADSDLPRTGSFHATFTQQDPHSPIDAQNRRHHIRDEALQHYVLSEESFEVYVPRDYDPAKAYGIMVWVSAGNRGSMPRGWQEIMDRQQMIFIGANESGNERGVAVRFGLAMDGVFNLRRQYTIDDGRVYVSGISGGGKIASMLDVVYPELFSGAIPIVGVAYYRAIAIKDDPTKGWAPSFAPPAATVLTRAKDFGRMVLITGSGDMNRDSIQGTYERGYLPDGFKFIEYVEVEGMGHTLPPPERFEQAIASLDKPLPQLAQRMLELGQQSQRAGKLDEAKSLYRTVMLHGDERLARAARELVDRTTAASTPPTRSGALPAPASRPAMAGESREAQAASMLSLADNYERNLMFSQARQRAQRVIQEFPETKAAAQAKAMLKRLESPR